MVSMAIGGSFAGFAAFKISRRLGLGLGIAAGLAGFAGDLITYLITSFELALALHGQESLPLVWATAFASFLPTQVPLAIAEALFTAGVVVFIANQRAELLEGAVVRP